MNTNLSVDVLDHAMHYKHDKSARRHASFREAMNRMFERDIMLWCTLFAFHVTVLIVLVGYATCCSMTAFRDKITKSLRLRRKKKKKKLSVK